MTLTWSKTPPDKPGWWWFRLGSRQSILLLKQTKAGIVMEGKRGLGVPLEGLNPGVDFAGPIPEPQEAALMTAEGGA